MSFFSRATRRPGRLALVALLCALGVLGLVAPGAEAGYTGTVDGTDNATLTADASGGAVTIDVLGGNLRHNLNGFNGNQDFDSVQPGDQMVADDSNHTVTVVGGAGDDMLDASAVTLDRVTLDGAGGNDTLKGGSMNDTLTGGSGADTLQGAGGDDTLNAGDGETDVSLDCGAGGGDVLNRDAASIDPDSIVTGCETVNTLPEPVVLPAVTHNAPFPAWISAIKAKASGNGTFITVDTGASGFCPLEASLSCALQAKATTNVPKAALKGLSSAKTKKITLGKLTDSLKPGQAKRIKFKLSKNNSRLFRKLKKLKISFTISVSTPGGQTARQAKTVTLKAPKKK